MGVNMEAHGGLRGACALWVMIFHLILYSKLQLDFQGSSLMPLFFILSGFALGVCYCAKPVEVFPPLLDCARTVGMEGKESRHVTPILDQEHQQAEKQLLWFDYTKFYRNRVARVFPGYYACLLYALPLWFAGFGSTSPEYTGEIVGSIFASFVPVTTLLSPLFGWCISVIDGPGWTVCTLVILWIYFPRWVPVVQRMSDEELVRGIASSYWLQAVLLAVCFGVMISWDFWPAFATATMNPLTRFPIFLMGLYAGVLCTRHADTPLPWPSSLLRFFPHCCSYAHRIEDTAESDRFLWTNVATRQAITLLLLTLTVFVLDTLDRVFANGSGIVGAVWLQCIVPFAQLEVIVALTRDGGKSLASRALITPLGNWLGKLSMAIYLVHYPTMRYLCWIVNGTTLTWPSFDCSGYSSHSQEYDNCEDRIERFNDAMLIPVWGIPVVAAVSMILAALLFYGIEEPARKALRS
jgi:peptidoglycan/LPS O-acetylase OafA/YrhL